MTAPASLRIIMLALVTISAPLGCTRDVTLLPPIASDGGAGQGGGGQGGGAPLDGAGVAGADGGLGPPVTLGGVCSSYLAERAHRFALCVCDPLDVTAPLNTVTFDSSSGATTSATHAAAVGVDATLQSSARIQADGAVYVAGAGGLTASMTVSAAASLRVGGQTHMSAGAAEVMTDAFIGGDLQGIFSVTGTLHYPPSASSALAIVTAGATVREAVTVTPPCNCGAPLVDTAAAISAAQSRNDNAAIGLDVNRLILVTSSTALDIPGGTYVISGIFAEASLLLAVHGHALLVSNGDVVLRGGLSVALDPGAELDLVIGGQLSTSGANQIGSMSPARFRIWVSGTGPVAFNDRPTLGAMVYAPNAAVMAPAGLALSGALFAKSLTAGGQVDVHYDQAVLSAGVSCGQPTASPIQ